MCSAAIKKYSIAVVFAVGFSAVLCTIPFLFFRNLDRLLPVAADIANISLPDSVIKIFEALHYADIQPPILMIFLICIITASVFSFLIRKKAHFFAAIPVIILLFVVAVLLSILLTNVNKVLFLKVLKALLPLL